MELKEHLIFVNSVFSTRLNDIIHQTIIDSVKSIEQTHPSNKRSNSGGYQSPLIGNNTFDNPSTMYLFNKYIIPSAKEIIKAWGIPKELDQFTYWYNVNNKFNYNKPHQHPMSYISGVYYIKVPKNSGNIIFERARDETDRMDFVTRELVLSNLSVSNSRINTQIWFTPQAGLLLLFPGHLMHSVDQNLTDDADDERISLSFNFI